MQPETQEREDRQTGPLTPILPLLRRRQFLYGNILKTHRKGSSPMYLQPDMALEGDLRVLLNVIRTGYIVQPHADARPLTDNTVMIPPVCLHSLGQSFRVQELGDDFTAT